MNTAFTKYFYVFSTLAAFQLGCTNARLFREVQSSVREVRSPFGTLNAVLATRNPACIMCHAKVHGDVITDFGYGDPFFMGTDNKTNHPNQQDYYNPFDSKHFIWGATDKVGWHKTSIMGDVYIPDVTLVDSRLYSAHLDPAAGNPPPTGPLTLLDFVTRPFVLPALNGRTVPETIRLIERTSSSNINVPGLRGEFRTRKKIWIDAPSPEEVRSLQQGKDARLVYSNLGVVVHKGQPTDVIDGLVAQQSSTNFRLFITHDPVVRCMGDVIIDGTVFLNHLQLETDDKGCRLYVTGSVFIQGPIKYLTGGNSNLQISSSRAIIMGMRSLSARLTDSYHPANLSGIRTIWTDSQELDFNTLIINDRDTIQGLTNDAGPIRVIMNPPRTEVLAVMDDWDLKSWVPAPGRTTFPPPATCGGNPALTCVEDWAEDYGRKSIVYEHLLLNAPKVYSRYYGEFRGVVIGEDVLFAVDHFEFQSDPVMTQVPLLPLVQNRIFSISPD